MRVALISLLERFDKADDRPIALHRLSGQSLAAHQLDCALAMGCERIVCLSEAMHDGLHDIQHRAEAAGARFHIIRGSRQLSGLVTAADELLVFADGLLCDQERLVATLGNRPAILLLPCDPALAAGFERVDASHGWAGVALVSGSAVERLTELPDDIDPVSALLRIGLQCGTRRIMLPSSVLSDEPWVLVRRREQLRQVVQLDLSRRLEPAPWVAPGLALADRLTGRLATVLMDRAIGPLALAGAALLVLGGALATAWSGFAGAGLLVLVLAAFLARMGLALGRLMRRRMWFGPVQAIVLDLAVMLIVAWDIRPEPLWPGIFPMLVLLGLARLGTMILPLPWKFFAQDRVSMALVLGIFGVFGILINGLQVIGLIALAAWLVGACRSGLTRA